MTADARRSWISEPHPTDAATGVCPECYSKGFADAEATAERRVTQLEEALRWYLEDDKRSVEQGILESVADRPALAALSAGEGAVKAGGEGTHGAGETP